MRLAIVKAQERSTARRMGRLRCASELAADKPHGVRIKYVGGCRCELCRQANTRYESERQRARKRGDWNGVVDCAAAIAHMKKLRKQGLGRRAIAESSGVPDSVLHELLQGRRRGIRARTERKIMAVTTDCRADHATIDARATWRLIDELLAEGYTRTRLANELGQKSGKPLQLGRSRVLVRTAAKVRAVHRRLTR